MYRYIVSLNTVPQGEVLEVRRFALVCCIYARSLCGTTLRKSLGAIKLRKNGVLEQLSMAGDI